MVGSSNAKRVFISYTHDSPNHRASVLQLANDLRSKGVDAQIDWFTSAPAEGWPRWMQNQIEMANFVVCVCTENYRRRFEGHEQAGQGRGATWEGQIIAQYLYECDAKNDRIIAVLPDGKDETCIPTVLRPYQWFRYHSQFEGLYRVITNQPEIIPPEIGDVESMPPINDI